ncbi:MAG: hypothetical protein KC503_14060, partial [Myxococcales bacterium]|nr:hypothetical protein [Myxococcales bacterium]
MSNDDTNENSEHESNSNNARDTATENESENEKKKQRVIHARVSDTVDEELRRRANHLGMSVSNLVRNILHHTFGLVEDLVVDVAAVASPGGEGNAPPGTP